MKLRILALAATVTALVACNAGGGNSGSVKVGLSSDDNVKFSYMLGTQFGMQVNNIGTQLELSADDAEFNSGIADGNRVMGDTAFKIKYPDSVMRNISQMMQGRAMALRAANQPLPKPDSTADSTQANVAQQHPAKPAPLSAEKIGKVSYLLGVQFGAQFASIAKQFDADLDVSAFKQGIVDFRAKAADTSKALQLPTDSLTAVGNRFREKMMDMRKAAMEKAKAEEDSLKNVVAPLRGDTLADGTQAKINYKVQVTGMSLDAKNFEAYMGKPLFIFYFSTTCGHCRHATPEIVEIVKKFKDKGITSIAVASGGNNKRDVRAYIDEFKLSEAGLDVFFDESRQFGELYSDGYVPKAYIVKPDGALMSFGNFEGQRDSIQVELGKLAK